MWTVAKLGGSLGAGKVTSRSLVEEAFGRIADPAGEGASAFLKTYAETALAEPVLRLPTAECWQWPRASSACLSR